MVTAAQKRSYSRQRRNASSFRDGKKEKGRIPRTPVVKRQPRAVSLERLPFRKAYSLLYLAGRKTHTSGRGWRRGRAHIPICSLRKSPRHEEKKKVYGVSAPVIGKRGWMKASRGSLKDPRRQRKIGRVFPLIAV